MSEWKKVIASDFCTEVTDGTHDSPKPVNVGKFLLTSKHLQEYSLDFANAYMISQEDYDKAISRSKVDQYDILFSMIGTIGTTHRVTIPNVDFAVKNMGIFKLGGDCLKSKWLYYWLKTKVSKEYINSCLSGTTQGYMTLKALRNFPISVPDPLTMESITSVLSSFDDKIAVNKKICENLEAQAQALFKYWFVDFVPFFAEQSGKAERKDGQFVESELGLIPEGWRVGKLSELIDVKYGKDHKKLLNGNIPVYGSGGLMRKVDRSLYEGESVLIPRKGTLNNVMYVNEAFWTVDTMFYSIPKRSNIALYTYILLSKRDLASMNAGSAVPSMTTDILNNMQIVIPNEDVLAHFNSLVSVYYAQIKHNEQESRRLATLLPKLMSGEITIGDVK